jgi:hypothetical protein
VLVGLAKVVEHLPIASVKARVKNKPQCHKQNETKTKRKEIVIFCRSSNVENWQFYFHLIYATKFHVYLVHCTISLHTIRAQSIKNE